MENEISAENLVGEGGGVVERKERLKKKFKNWFDVPSNKLVFLILIGIIILRIYYFWISRGQAVWWDEAEYLSLAKSYAGIVDYGLVEQRLPGFPLMMSIFFIMGITNEIVLRFIFNLLPSIFVIVIFYFLIKEMYSNKKIAIISTIILSILWEHLFYSNRFHTENISLIFEFLAILVLFKVYMKKEDLGFIKPKYSLIWILILTGLSVFVRPGNLLFFPSVVIFVLLLNQELFFKKQSKKKFLISLILMIVGAILVLFNLEKIPLLRTYYYPDRPVTWKVLSIFQGFYISTIPGMPSLLFLSFLLGIIIVFFNIFLMYDYFKKLKRNTEYLDFKSDVFNLLLIGGVFFVFIFLMKSTSFEYRWFFIIAPAMIAFTSKGIIYFSKFVASFLGSKHFFWILIILIVSLGVYNQVNYADDIIKNKINTYSQVKEAGLWIKKNSDKNDVVLSRSFPQTVYYSERKTYKFQHMNESEFFDLVEDVSPVYMIESALEPNPGKWGLVPTEKMMEILEPIKIWYADADKTQPILIIYKIHIQNLEKNSILGNQTISS